MTPTLFYKKLKEMYTKRVTTKNEQKPRTNAQLPTTQNKKLKDKFVPTSTIKDEQNIQN